jgi:hypothetical protein
VALCRAEAVRAELPFPVAELPPPGAEARQFHAGRGEDHLRDVQQEGKLVSQSHMNPFSMSTASAATSDNTDLPWSFFRN